MNSRLRNAAAAALMLTALLCSHTDWVQGKKKPIRVVSVKVVADRIFASQEVWHRKAARQIEDVSEEIRGLLGVDLKIIGYAEWRHEGGDNIYDVADRMMGDIPTDQADILIGFTYGPCPEKAGNAHTDGVAIPFRGLVMRNYYEPCDHNEFLPYALIHEFVHLFGGVHVGQGTLMSPVFSGNIFLELDPINRAIVNLTRDIDFKRGYESLDKPSLEKLVKLYRQAIDESGGDLAVLTDLADVYRTLGRFDTALDIYRGILGFDSTGVHTWLNIAQCYFGENRTDSALDILEEALEHTADSGQVYYRIARFKFTLGAYEQAYKFAAQAAWRGVSIDSSFLAEIKRHYAPGEQK